MSLLYQKFIFLIFFKKVLTYLYICCIIGIVLEGHKQTNNTCGCSSVVEHQPSKLDMWVRFPSPAYARVAQLVERDLAKVEAAGSSPVSRFYFLEA